MLSLLNIFQKKPFAGIQLKLNLKRLYVDLARASENENSIAGDFFWLWRISDYWHLTLTPAITPNHTIAKFQ